MEKKRVVKKGIAVSIVVLFFCSSLLSATQITTSTTTRQDKEKLLSDETNTMIPCTFYFFGKTGIEQYKSMVSHSDATQLAGLLNQLKTEISISPTSENTQRLQQNFFDILQKKAVPPPDITKEQFMSLIQPPTIPSSYPVKNPVLLGNRASERLCTFVSEGSGAAFPIIILPRFIPILLTPIPRVILRWNAKEGFTSCGGLRSGTGFISYGQQKGIALGFWGVGFTFSLPPVMNTYGLLGYALYASVTADQIDHYPPNNPPEITETDPVDGQTMVPISTSELRFKIEDMDNDLMSYTVTTEPDIGSGSGGLKSNGVYSVPISGLQSYTTYTWTIQVTDGKDSIQQTFTFTTEPTAPVFSNPTPADGMRDVPQEISSLKFTIKDYQGDDMDYTVETTPDIGSSSGTNVHDGTYTTLVNGAAVGTTYHWFVNITDGTHWTREHLSFETGYPTSFNPFDYGWTYKKQITIDHTKVVDDLTNFPILVSTTDEDLKQKTQGNGGDILFMNTAGQSTRLYHDLDTYDSSTGALVAWVNIPTLSSTQNTTLYMYYGNPTCIDQSYPEKTWDSYYVGIWHMNDKTSQSIIDSTSFHNDGKKRTSGHPSETNGAIGFGQRYSKVDNDFIAVTRTASLDITHDFTMEAWINLLDPIGILVWKDVYSPRGYDLEIYNGKLFGYIGYGEGMNRVEYHGSVDVICDGRTWTYVTVTVHVGSTDGYIKTYVNGQHDTTLSYPYGSITVAELDLYLGGNKFNVNVPDGIIDEIRISNGIPRDDSWILTSYQNQNDPTDFVLIGPEEPGP